jgi:seryl-tRNA synthetase
MDNTEQRRRQSPARTPEAREKQLIAAAMDLAEKQILEGTASSQVLSHFLKLGSTREKLEQKNLQENNKLLSARTKAIGDAKTSDNLLQEALAAMKRYSGRMNDSDEPV